MRSWIISFLAAIIVIGVVILLSFLAVWASFVADLVIYGIVATIAVVALAIVFERSFFRH